jgi:hypothetical protein
MSNERDLCLVVYMYAIDRHRRKIIYIMIFTSHNDLRDLYKNNVKF